MHEALGHPNPDFSHSMVMLQQTVCGVWSVLSKEGGDQRTCLPITLELLLKFRKVWEKDAGCFDIIMLWEACTICFLDSSEQEKS